MAFELKALGRQKVIYDNDNAGNPLVYQLVINGEKVVPTSATIAVYRRGVSTAKLAATAMTLTGSVLTYELDTTTEADFPIEYGYRATISITYDGNVYVRPVIFDVVRYVLDFAIGVDQLIGIDSNVAGMVHDGDDDFSALVVASRAIINGRLEAKVLNGGKLIENAILDPSQLAVCAAFHVLAQLWMNARDFERRDDYRERFDRLMDAILANMRFDEDQDGEESSTPGQMQDMRFET